MANPFDTLNGDENMGGFFSRISHAFHKVNDAITKPIKKLTKKLAKPVVKLLPKSVQGSAQKMLSPNPLTSMSGTYHVVREVENKTLPKGLIALRKRAEKNKYVQAAGLAVASVYAAPVVASYLGGAGAAAAGAGAGATGITAGHVAATVGKALVSVAGKEIAKHTADKKAAVIAAKQKQIETMKKDAEHASFDAQILSKDPSFADTIDKLRAAGYSDNQILSTWLNSQQYAQTAALNASRAVYPQILSQYQSAGIPQQQAQQMARTDAAVVGANSAAKAKQAATGIDAKTILMIALPTMAAIMSH